MWQRQAVRRYKRVHKVRPYSRHPKYCLYYSLASVFVTYIAYILYNPERYVNKFPEDINNNRHDDPVSSKKMPLAGGTVIGIVIGVVALLLLIIGAIIFCCCVFFRRQQVLHRPSIPGAGTYMPRSEYGRSAGVPYPRIWNNTYKYKMDQAQRIYYRPSLQQQYQASDPRLRHAPQRNGSYPQQGHGPTVFVYQSDPGIFWNDTDSTPSFIMYDHKLSFNPLLTLSSSRKTNSDTNLCGIDYSIPQLLDESFLNLPKDQPPPPSNAPRFYWRDEAEDVTTQRDDGSTAGDTSPTTNDPIVEFPDDDDDDDTRTGNHYEDPDSTEKDS